MKKKSAIIAASALSVALLAGCSVSTGPSEVALEYDAGTFSSTTFDKCVNPGNREWLGPEDQSFVYPAGQRNYVFKNNDENSDRGAYGVITKDPVSLDVEGQITFELNTDCEVLKTFHERIGKDKDWSGILSVYLDQALNRAIQEATTGFTWNELLNDNVKKQAWDKAVLEKLPEYVKQATGGEYFRNFGVTLQKPILPQKITDAINGVEEARQNNIKQEMQNATITTELDSIKELVAVLGVNGYLGYSGKVQIVPVPDGSAVNVTPR